MTPVQIIFIVTAILTLGSALLVVTTRNLVHAALWLIVTLFGVAVYYVMLNAGFLAVAQIVIYIGAIAILVIFAVMMTRRIVGGSGPQVNKIWWLAALLAAVVFASLVGVLSTWSGFTTPAPEPAADPLVMLGKSLVDPQAYLLPFELASVLLLAALVGAIMIAWIRKDVGGE